MFDAAERLVVCNDLYIQMYGLSREIVKPGYSFCELLQYRAEDGSGLQRVSKKGREHIPDPETVSCQA